MGKGLLGFLFISALVGCGEWRPYRLHNPTTGHDAACYTSWGVSLTTGGTSLPPEQIHALHECIAFCQLQGYVLNDPDDVPPDQSHEPAMRRLRWLQCE